MRPHGQKTCKALKYRKQQEECGVRLSRKSEYALLALIDLARQHEKTRFQKIVEVAERNDIPKKYLEQIFLQLKGAGYVRSIRGAQGGYELAKTR